MAQLPKYERMTPTYEGIAGITDVVITQENITSERINKFLDTAKTEFQAKAIDYATDKAVEDAIRNPITAEQLDQAMNTGGNPVESYLKGGTAYNEAITKVVGQQVAGELNIELAQHNINVLEQVRKGELTNSEEMLAKLKEPIQAQIEFFANIDPVMAQSFGSNATANAHVALQNGIKIFKNKEEEKAVANASVTMKQGIDNFSKFLSIYPDSDPQIIQKYKDTVLKTTIDTSLSMTREQEKYSQIFKKALDEQHTLHVAKDASEIYTGFNINEAINDLEKYDNTKIDFNKAYSGNVLTADKQNLAKYYHDMNIEEQKSFKSLLRDELATANSGLAANTTKVKKLLKRGDSYINTFQPVPIETLNEISMLINPDPESQDFVDFQALQKFSANLTTYNKRPYTDLVAENNQNLIDRINTKTSESPEELADMALLNGYVKNIQDGLKIDPTAIVTQRVGDFEPIDLFSENASEQIERRRKTMDTQGPLYGMSKSRYSNFILTNEEVSGFLNQYMKGNGEQKIAMLRVLDDVFGDDSQAAMLQLSEAGLPSSAQMASYFNDVTVTEQFVSLETPGKKKELEQALVDNNEDRTITKVRQAVAKEIITFTDSVKSQSGFDNTNVVSYLNSMTEDLSYLVVSEMQRNGNDYDAALNKVTDLINEGYNVTKDGYYIPTRYNNNRVSQDIIEDKAYSIQENYLLSFDPVPFGSDLDEVTSDQERTKFYQNLERFGMWQNSLDGKGLVFGIELPKVGFTPIQNYKGEKLFLQFDDTTYTLPNSGGMPIEIKEITIQTRRDRIMKKGREGN